LSQNTFFDTIIIACGKAPNVENLGLDMSEVKAHPEHGIYVDNFLCTTNPHVYAVGDCISTRVREGSLTGEETSKHKDYYVHYCEKLATYISKNSFLFARNNWTELMLPRVIYTSLEVAVVGRYSHELDA
jgi:pyruvate/2-oxoglutarate dehydrogenase complex dihydrolipoamide dehydrogenase (E3) component